MKETGVFSRSGHQAVHQRSTKEIIFHTPRQANIQSGATRSTLGTYPDGLDAISLADDATDGFNTTFTVPQRWVPRSPVFVTLYYTMQTNSGGNVVLRYNYLEYTGSQAAGDSGTQTDVTITPIATVNVQTYRRQLMIPVGKNLVRLSMGRMGGDAADTYAATLRVVGWDIEYTIKGVSR